MSDNQNQKQSNLPVSSQEFFPREYVAGDLIGDAVEAIIIHAGERYRLRITTNNRLILTK